MEQRSKKLERQYKRYLGSADAEKLIAEAADMLAQGNPPEVGSKHHKALLEFSSFAEAIDKAYAEYDDRLNMSARNIELSSKELTVALRDLEQLNLSINTMLDSLGNGLLFFDEDGTCSQVYSKACLEILRTNPAGKYLPDILDFTDDQKANFQSWLTIVFSGNMAMDFSDLKSLLPQEITNDVDAIIKLDYRPMYLAGDVLTGVLLIATDVTQERSFEQSIKRAQGEVLKNQQISMNRNEFSSFLFNLDGLLDTRETVMRNGDEKALMSYMRALHTLKGYALFFNMDALAHEIHVLEEKLKTGTISQEDTEPLQAVFEEEKELGRKLFGANFMAGEQIKTVHFSKIDGLKELIAKCVQDESVSDQLVAYINAELLSSPIFEKFEPFKKELNRLAEQMGKPIPECRINGENLSILSHEYEEFFNSLIHLARNIMDHGIEEAKIRQYKNKSEQGVVEVNVEQIDGEKLEIVISDDGNGIDPEKIRERLKAVSNDNFEDEDDDEIIGHVFDPSFTTLEGASLISGQGVGMSAIKECVSDLGGEISIHSDYRNGGGTTLQIKLPYIS